jgi:hypothetical protein
VACFMALPHITREKMQRILEVPPTQNNRQAGNISTEYDKHKLVVFYCYTNNLFNV